MFPEADVPNLSDHLLLSVPFVDAFVAQYIPTPAPSESTSVMLCPMIRTFSHVSYYLLQSLGFYPCFYTGFALYLLRLAAYVRYVIFVFDHNLISTSS